MNRYRLEADQQRFSIARSILRVLLGRQVDLNPIDIHFTDIFNKKPRLKDFAHVHHSVSHSGDWIVIAIAGSPVGIDVEKVDSNFFFPDVVAHSFSQAEKEYIENNDSPRTRFYQLWTRKEALAKAKGHGIDDNFYRIPSIDGTHNVEKEPPYFTENWAISGFNVAGEYLAAIAYRLETTRQAIHFFNVDPDLLSSQSV
ncbi:MAG: 4'-phosphopantetheinyl transferase superfamily protein [Cytophagaceae bacterium]|nr:4'-phosphopantetheinyl transferase superfamily protein [Cytophagaceae bacterium]